MSAPLPLALFAQRLPRMTLISSDQSLVGKVRRRHSSAAPCRPSAAGLEGYLAIERRRPACGDPQHIFQKLLFDAVNEALLSHYGQVGGGASSDGVHQCCRQLLHLALAWLLSGWLPIKGRVFIWRVGPVGCPLPGKQALDSYTGRTAPRVALLSRERIEQNVVQRVLRWAGMGACRGGDAIESSAMAGLLAEDALEVSPEPRRQSRGGAVLSASMAPC